MNAFRGLTPCRLVGRYQRFEKYIVSIFRAEEAILGSWMDLYKMKKKEEKAGGMEHHFNPDEEDRMFLRNVSIVTCRVLGSISIVTRQVLLRGNEFVPLL
jgi:hypothetical protein